MPDRDPLAAIKDMVDPALQALSENRRKRNLQLERALRKAVNALEKANSELREMKEKVGFRSDTLVVIAETETTLTEIKGVLGDD